MTEDHGDPTGQHIVQLFWRIVQPPKIDFAEKPGSNE